MIPVSEAANEAQGAVHQFLTSCGAFAQEDRKHALRILIAVAQKEANEAPRCDKTPDLFAPNRR